VNKTVGVAHYGMLAEMNVEQKSKTCIMILQLKLAVDQKNPIIKQKY